MIAMALIGKIGMGIFIVLIIAASWYIVNLVDKDYAQQVNDKIDQETQDENGMFV